jgi:hypothetical protein
MATDVHQVLMTRDTSTEIFYGVYLTGGAFNFIGVKPLIGRTIQPFDIRSGGKPDALWYSLTPYGVACSTATGTRESSIR